MYKHALTRRCSDTKTSNMAFAPHRVALYLILAGFIIDTLIK